jgi:hypothetical protein
MTRRLIGIAAVAMLILTTSCTAAQKRNTAVGAGLGTAAGALIGYPGHVVTGAVIGGAAGGALGYGLTDD